MLARMPRTSNKVYKQAFFLAGHIALDFLNTEWRSALGKEDFFETDADVLHWLRQAKAAPDDLSEVRPSGALLRAAQALRSVIRTLVVAKKAGKQPDLSDLNAFLAAAHSHQQLSWTKSKTIVTKTVRAADTAEQVLAPVSVAAAELLSEGNFRRVRKCDDPTCVLWFYDRTKAGRRRWCSMASCGNRLKVKTYRGRLKSR